MLLFLGVAILLLLVPTGAQAAGAKFRVLNAAVSGPVTVQVNGKTKISKLKLGRTSRRIPLAAGRYTFSAKRGNKTVTALSVRLGRNERVTVVFAMKGKKPQLFLLREPRVARGAILLRAANFASSAGAVDFRLGGLVIGRKVGFGGSTTIRKVAPNFTLTGSSTSPPAARRRRPSPRATRWCWPRARSACSPSFRGEAARGSSGSPTTSRRRRRSSSP
jgi:hypothetical protein